jgi:hypothetical protein
MNKPEFNFNDIVHVAGYEPQIFVIDGYRAEHYYYPDEDWVDLVYECHDFFSGEWIECDAEDISLVASAEDAEEYLSGITAPPEKQPGTFGGNTMSEIMQSIFGMEAGIVAKEERKPTARELSSKEAADRKKARKEKAEKIDRLLDELNDYKRLVAEFDDEEHKARVEYTLLKLAELTE